MGKMTRPGLKLYILRVIMMLMAILFMVIPVIRATDSRKVECDRYKFDDNWTVTVRDDNPVTVKLSEFSFKIANKNDRITLVNTIPKEAEGISDPIINFYSVHSVVDVYLDDELCYSYGRELYEAGELLGYGDHYIAIPDDYVGRKIRIELTVTENSAFDGIQALWIEDSKTFFKKELAERRSNLIVSCFLALFGLIIMVLSVLMLKNNKNFIQTFCIAMFSFVIACWTFCNSDLITFIVTDLRDKVYMEYMTMYVLPIPLVYYFRDRAYGPGVSKYMRFIFWGLIGIMISFVITAFISQSLNLGHFPEFLPYEHLIIVLCMIFILAINIMDARWKRKNGKREINSVMLGIAIAFVLIVVELLRYNLSKYFTSFEGNEYNSSLSFAVLIVVISLMVDYGQSVSRTLYEDAQQKLLAKMAFVDELTGLANRRKCEDTLDEMQSTKTPYSVISFDLNFLKTVNDTMGHDKGDIMLKKFSDTLLEVFGRFGVVGRMGGDEFMAVLPNETKAETEMLMKELMALIRVKNSEDKIITLSTAYGVADSSEVDIEEDSHAAYRLADARMYEYKRKTNHGRT